MVPSQINARTKIIEILSRVETRQSYTDKLLDRDLDEFEEADRGLITEVVNGVLRWQYRLDWYLQQLYVGEYQNLIADVKNNLRSSAYQLIYLDKVPAYAVLNEAVEIAKSKYNQKTANLVNAILRNFLRQQKKLSFVEMQLPFPERLCVRFSHPAWLIERWLELWGLDDTLGLCEANNSRPVISVRHNARNVDRETLLREMEAAGIDFRAHPDFPEYFMIGDFSRFRQTDFLKDGWVSVQDVSTGIPVRLLDPHPGEEVLDMCAAPGGKSAYIVEKMNDQGYLLALEKHGNRTRILEENLNRIGASIAEILTGDALELVLDRKFDRILLDAPCSGLGVLSKRVDLRWKRTPEDIQNMQDLQIQLLDAATRLLKPGGIIVYSTCTITVEENESVISRFLADHPDFRTDSLMGEIPNPYLWEKDAVRTFPHRHDMDGSFAVRLRHFPG